MVPLVLQNPLLEGLLRYVSKVRDAGLKTAVFVAGMPSEPLQVYFPHAFHQLPVLQWLLSNNICQADRLWQAFANI